MTRTFSGRFNGKAIIPDSPVDLPQRRKLVVRIESVENADDQGMSGAEFLRAIEQLDFSKKDRREIEQAIADGCEQVDDDGE